MDEIIKDALKTACEASWEAGRLIKDNWNRTKQVSTKTGITDLVTNVDKEADKLITEKISRRFPTHTVVAEESARSGPESPYCWYIDPIDGTTNFAHRYPHFAVSIALTYQSRPIVGVVYDPLLRETFRATAGGGAFLNGSPITVSTESQLERSLLQTGFPYDRHEYGHFYLQYYEAFMLLTQGVRRSGSAALDLCYVACGRAEGFWEWRLQPWDVAAGALIVEQAAGETSDFSGHPFEIKGEQTLASNSHIHKKLLAQLRLLPNEPA